MGKVLASDYPRNTMMRRAVPLAAAFLCCGADGSAAAADWSPVTTPAPGPTKSIGFYTAGCLQGAEALPLDGPGCEAIRISRNRYWGQPVMVEYIQGLAAKVHTSGHAPLYIGAHGPPPERPRPTRQASPNDA